MAVGLHWGNPKKPETEQFAQSQTHVIATNASKGRQGYRLEVESFLSSASFQRYKKRDKNYRTAGSEGDGHPREKESCSPGRESSPPSSPPLQQTPGRWLCFPSRPLKAQISLLRNQSSHLKQKSELTPAWLRNQQWLPGAF